MTIKRQIREDIKHLRSKQSFKEKVIKDKKILNRLEKLTAFKKAKKILFFAATQSEIDTFPLLEKYLKKKTCLLPKTDVKTKTLLLYPVDALSELYVGPYNILEPKPKHKPLQPKNLDLILIPGIAFDKKGYRIGYGGGFYDRLLKKTNCPAIGLAYEFQIIDNVPGEPNDVPVDMIVTEKRTIKIKKRRVLAGTRPNSPRVHEP